VSKILSLQGFDNFLLAGKLQKCSIETNKMTIDLEQIKSVSYGRSQTLAIREEDISGDELTFSFSSEAPVERWWGTEILSHEKSCARLERLNDRGAFLFNHNRNILLGSTLKAWLEDDKRAYVTIRWSNRDDVKGYRSDCEEGHLTHVSFAYDIYQIAENAKEEYLVTDWEAFEVSLVTIPADPSVGVGRDRERPLILGKENPVIAIPKSYQGEIMPTAARVAAEAERVAAEAERDRIRAIQILGDRHNVRELAQTAIEEGTTLEAFRKIVLDQMGEREQRPIAAPSDGFLGLSANEQRRYSLLKALSAEISGDWSQAGFERECHRTLKGQGFRSNGLLIPLEALGEQNRATYTVSGNVEGAGNLVATQYLGGSFIDALRATSFAYAMGATGMDGLQGDVEIPRQNGVASLGWIAEDTDLPESQASFDTISLKPKTVGAWCQLSRLIATQSYQIRV
jgi:HK97 family phage prohead protease